MRRSTNEDVDSTMGKIMEKAGNMMKNDNIAEKGRAKRDAAGYGDDNTGSNY